MKSFVSLAAEIAHREGKKSQVKIGDIREILRILIDIEAQAAYHTEQHVPSEMLNASANKLLKKLKLEKPKK
jgi:2-phosphoglycerate kinase